MIMSSMLGCVLSVGDDEAFRDYITLQLASMIRIGSSFSVSPIARMVRSFSGGVRSLPVVRSHDGASAALCLSSA